MRPLPTVLAALLGALLVAGPRPAAAAQPSLNAYFQSTLKDPAYQKKTFERVARRWKAPPAAGFPKPRSKTVVQAVLTKEGKLASTTVSTSSGSKRWDEAALAAVMTAAPFDPLPAGYGYPTLEVHFHVSLEP